VAAALLVMLVTGVTACAGSDESSPNPTSNTASSDGGQASSTTTGSVTTSTLSLHDRIQQEQSGVTTSPPVTGAVTTITEATETTVDSTTTSASQGTSSTAGPTSTTAKSTTTTVKPTTTTVKGPIVLTLVGPSGTQQLSMAELKAMWATSGYGGWKNQLGNITAPVPWKGVALTNLIELAGGGSSVVVTASDGYEQPLSAGEIGGAVATYDPTTGEQISSINGSITVIVAYTKNGGAIAGEEGPLRIAFVSPAKDQVTDSFMWVRMVKKIVVQ
jgi:hypothetical protein